MTLHRDETTVIEQTPHHVVYIKWTEKRRGYAFDTEIHGALWAGQPETGTGSSLGVSVTEHVNDYGPGAIPDRIVGARSRIEQYLRSTYQERRAGR